jgi:hypothetical protein
MGLGTTAPQELSRGPGTEKSTGKGMFSRARSACDDPNPRGSYFIKKARHRTGKTVKRGDAKKANYILSYKPNLPLAVIEATDNHHSVGVGMQQRWKTLSY